MAEQIITSPVAERMLRRVSPIYEGIVALSIFQAIGLEWDAAWQIFRNMRGESNPLTATQMLSVWEAAYGIVPPVGSSIADRRLVILARRQSKVPISPWGLAERLRKRFAREALVYDTDTPYTISVELTEMPGNGSTPISLFEFNRYVNQIKPAHLSAERHIHAHIGMTINLQANWEEILFRMCGEVLAGSDDELL